MKQSILCKWFGLHTFEVLKEEDFLDKKGNVIGRVIVSRCSVCGKIKSNCILTEDNGRF